MDNNSTKLKIYIIAFIIGLLGCSVLYFSSKSFERKQEENIARGIRLNQEIAKNFKKREEDLKKQKKPLTMIFVGDIMLSRSVEKKMNENVDVRFPFLSVADRLSKADIAIGNLEGPISSRGRNQGSIYSFRAKPAVLDGITYAGFDVFSLANNHIFDWGRDALNDTMQLLTSSSIAYVGVGKNYDDANELKKIERNGYTVGFLSYTKLYPKSLFASSTKAGISEYDEEKIIQRIKDYKSSVDVLVVLFHWGDEYKTHSNADQEKLGRACIDAGADLVVGHHPHVAQEIEKYKEKTIAYSLGNFIFDQPFSEETMNGLALDVVCSNPHECKANPVYVKINKDFQPEFEGL